MNQQLAVVKKDRQGLWIWVADDSKLVDLILNGDFQAADSGLYNEMLELKEELHQVFKSYRGQ